MKTSLSILLVICLLFAITVRSQSVVWIKYGECYNAMNNLKESVDNDSVAVQMFWENYIIIDKNVDYLKKKTPTEVIKFFNQEENKQLMCEHKRFVGEKVLLDNHTIR